MKLVAGVKKIILTIPANAEENSKRHSARGIIFKPVFVVWVVSPNGDKAVAHECFSFRAKSITPRTSLGNFPYTWANSSLRNVRVWMETEGELEIVTTQPEDMK